MGATFAHHHRQGGGDPSLQAAAALNLAAADIARAVGDGLQRTSAGGAAIKAAVETNPGGASLVLTARHGELASAMAEARADIARILRSAWLKAGQGVHHHGGLPDGD